MSKKILLFVCSVLLCTSLIGCGAQKAEENNNTDSGTESYNTISPLPSSIDINNLDNCTLPVSLEEGDAYVDDTGAMQMDVTVYTYDLYSNHSRHHGRDIFTAEAVFAYLLNTV